MKEFHKHKVHEKVTMQECWDETGQRPIGLNGRMLTRETV